MKYGMFALASLLAKANKNRVRRMFDKQDEVRNETIKQGLDARKASIKNMKDTGTWDSRWDMFDIGK